jgi:hypothetical protein
MKRGKIINKHDIIIDILHGIVLFPKIAFLELQLFPSSDNLGGGQESFLLSWIH